MEQRTGEALERGTRSGNVRQLAYMALFVALYAVCAWITVPAAVPFTMQTFAVFLSAGLLGGKRSAGAVLAYLALGATGLPVFSGFTGGFSRLIGPTGGYLVGFVCSALIVGAVAKRFGRSAVSLALGMAAGLLACYAFGTAWFLLVYGQTTGPVSLAAALSWCVLPFLLPDLAKIALAVFLTKRLERFVKL